MDRDGNMDFDQQTFSVEEVEVIISRVRWAALKHLNSRKEEELKESKEASLEWFKDQENVSKNEKAAKHVYAHELLESLDKKIRDAVTPNIIQYLRE